ncbi:hypothetical protein GCM10011504_19540 [Siccirubricoccus deserti]|uniref:FkbM family methyltransferase n=1 Tax=Siccirubricoccus deserti TaxID=2013562 RepID=A0A9X0QX06_9PROT|nr:FkbM family methyltransferase [Siccirubricoccus deserti]MBC4015379.1 FkbM family methyltransferase [Siccirubricoccus deserti]GGC41167.1 hypothetical protein GCM10011504_19540 [Siccirubricoccus deserti]
MSGIMHRMRTLLNTQLGRRGYSLKWRPPHLLSSRDQVIELSFATLAAHLMLTTPRPFFIGIGANDGVTHDPIFPFIRDFGWRGIMVEPIPEAFAKLKDNYAPYPDVTLIEAAVGKIDSVGVIYSIDMSTPNSLSMSLHSSFSRDVLLKGRQWHSGLESHIVERQVPIISFETLLRSTKGQPVDVLKIDAEGYDLEILKTIDLEALAPQLVLVEHANIQRSGKIEMAERLSAAGYRVELTSLDMLAYKEGAYRRAQLYV